MFSGNLFNEPVVIAVASSLSDPKVIVEDFREKFNSTFGRDRPIITKGNLHAAEYLRKKHEGITPKDRADEYILRHPSEFPKDPTSKEYKESKRKLIERMKKGEQRLLSTLEKIVNRDKD